VVAPGAALADALATAFFVGGPETVKRYHREHPDVSVVVIDMPLKGKYRPPAPTFLGRRADWRLPVAT
jgi:thiamine biosynthesis lipoprotein ApbE